MVRLINADILVDELMSQPPNVYTTAYIIELIRRAPTVSNPTLLNVTTALPNTPQRLLALPEVLNHGDVIIELRSDKGQEWHLGYILNSEMSVTNQIAVYMTGRILTYYADKYGVTWRCWDYSDIRAMMDNTPWEQEGASDATT